MIQKLKQYWNSFTPELKRFLITALVLIVVWKLSYHLYLKPHRIIDRPLTSLTAATTVKTLGFFFSSDQILSHKGIEPTNNFSHYVEIILLNNNKVLGIADPCNALELFILYIGFLFCLYTTLKRFVAFAILGIAAIFVINILRCCGMVWFGLHKQDWFDFAHHYLFTLIVYAAIFGLWVLYSKKNTHEV
ncbi:MAG: exosortase/archaeosortase family protein [Chitinophagaceae bacterium]|jgi:exosortase/archaeosortase family protein|nr:exosortase/archaeosortase family protein [Chitinophagaceae bacterium]